MRTLTICVALCAATLGASAQEFDQAKLSNIPEVMKKFVDVNQLSGAVTCVATRDKIVALDAVGLADIKTKAPMKTDTIFWVASMTKPLTGASIAMLQEQGKLKIDDPVSKYIPEFADIKTPSGNPANLTIKNLLTHTSGLAEPDKPAQSAKNLEELVTWFVKKPLLFEPGSEWRYSQSGINSLGRVIEIVSGKSYPDFVRENFLEPLGMKNSTFYPTAEQMQRVAKSYKLDHDTGKLEETGISLLKGVDFTSHDRVALPNAGLFSTAPDYARFMRMLLNNGSLDGKTYLKPESVKLMTTSLTGDLKAGFVPARHGWGYAVGIVEESKDVTEFLSPGTFGHGGAYGTQAWADPVKGVVYVLMIQRSDIGNSDDSEMRKAFQKAAAGAVK